MALFSTAGADAVHLSAGAEDGNGVKCQVEHCPGSLSRWAELNALHAPAACAIKVWTMAPPPRSTVVAQDEPHYSGREQHAGTRWPLFSLSLRLRGRPTRQHDLRLRGREPRGSAARPSAETSGKLQPVRAGRACFVAPHHPSSFPKRGGEECGCYQPAGTADLAAPGQRRHGRTQFGLGENSNLSQSARQRCS